MIRVAPRPDSGQATVAAIGVIAAVLTLVLGALDVARAVALSHRSRGAADLAALAAAGLAAQGETPSAACARAAYLAGTNGAQLSSCQVSSEGVVSVTTVVTSRVPWPRTALGTARAGPG